MFDQGWGRDLTSEAFASPSDAASAAARNVSEVAIKKYDEEQQLVYGEVYAPGLPDSQGDFMSRENIQVMAHGFLRKGLVNKIDLNHTQEESGCYVVESFIARDGDPTFIPGSWVIGVKVPDTSVWNLIKSGELNGFSLDGTGLRVDAELEIEMPDVIHGETDIAAGHKHEFSVRYDDEGNFLGGVTGPSRDGHVHRILRGTATEPARGHSHRFSFVEGVLNVTQKNQGE